MTAVVDTLGPMPFMQNPALLPPEGDPKVERARGDLADFQSQLRAFDREQKDEEAILVCRRYVEQQKLAMGPDSPFVGVGQTSLARFAERAHQWTVADAALRDALRLRSLYLGDGCMDTASTVNDLAFCLMNEGKTAEARDLVARYWASAQKQPASLGARVYYMHTLGLLSQALGRREQAAAYFTEAVALKCRNPASLMLQPNLYDLLSESARCDIDLGRYDSALASLIDYGRQHYGKKRSSDAMVLQMLIECARNAEAKHNLPQAQLAIKTASQLVREAWVTPQTRQDITSYSLRLGIN